MREWSTDAIRSGRRIALVPTMGALHDGHLALVRAARACGDVVVVSIFVNPLQFGEPADFDRYPRPIDDDLAACATAGVDAVYAAHGGRHVSRRLPDTGRRRPTRPRDGGQQSPRTLRRGGHRGHQALRRRPARRGRVRREGLPAARRHPSAGGRSRPRGRRRRPSHREGARWPGDVEPESPADGSRAPGGPLRPPSRSRCARPRRRALSVRRRRARCGPTADHRPTGRCARLRHGVRRRSPHRSAAVRSRASSARQLPPRARGAVR